VVSEFHELLRVQEFDTRVTQLEHQLTHDPCLAERTAAVAALAAVDSDIADAHERRDVVRREQKRLEDESATMAAKVEKVNGQLYGGTVTAHKELETLQEEIAILQHRVNDLDDLVLEQMEAAEPIDAELASLEQQRTAATARLEDAERAVTVMTAEVEAELVAVQGERSAAAATLPAELMSTYEVARKSYGGLGAAHLAPGGRCEGCHLTLPRAEYEELKRAPADAILVCPECGRLLVR
jgi:predicted  nucleic acid-binding Zn-ribbon protein